MGNFQTEAHFTLLDEGFYSCDPDDTGKETIYGISRVFHPNEDIWHYVDSYKSLPNFPQNMAGDQVIRSKALVIGKREYWDVVRGDEVGSQAICEALFDASYNLGAQTAIKFLQGALNKLNNDGKRYPDVAESGIFDDATLEALKVLLEYVDEGEFALWLGMNILKGMHYFTNTKEKYFKGLILNRTFKPETLRRLFPSRFAGRMPSQAPLPPVVDVTTQE